MIDTPGPPGPRNTPPDLCAARPAFTAAASSTLALGIGANTTIFSLIEAVMLRTLPVAAPDELQFVAIGLPGGDGDQMTTASNYPWFERVRQRTDVFAGVTAFNIRNFKVASESGAERVVGQYVSGNYHALVGVPMALGRGFTSEDDRAPGSSPIAVISDGYWSRRFGRRSDIIGQTLLVGRTPADDRRRHRARLRGDGARAARSRSRCRCRFASRTNPTSSRGSTAGRACRWWCA